MINSIIFEEGIKEFLYAIVVPISSLADPSHLQQTTLYFKSTVNRKTTGSDGTFNVKVKKAWITQLVNGRVDFERGHDERSANIHTVTNAVQSKWGSGYVVVTGDGLEVDNSAGTQGI